MELLTIEEVADRLRVSVLTVRWLTAAVSCPAFFGQGICG
jgi:orotate phosphoribosyltransferase-like protein